jgi:hypothetical protein
MADGGTTKDLESIIRASVKRHETLGNPVVFPNAHSFDDLFDAATDVDMRNPLPLRRIASYPTNGVGVAGLTELCRTNGKWLYVMPKRRVIECVPECMKLQDNYEYAFKILSRVDETSEVWLQCNQTGEERVLAIIAADTVPDLGGVDESEEEDDVVSEALAEDDEDEEDEEVSGEEQDEEEDEEEQSKVQECQDIIRRIGVMIELRSKAIGSAKKIGYSEDLMHMNTQLEHVMSTMTDDEKEELMQAEARKFAQGAVQRAKETAKPAEPPPATGSVSSVNVYTRLMHRHAQLRRKQDKGEQFSPAEMEEFQNILQKAVTVWRSLTDGQRETVTAGSVSSLRNIFGPALPVPSSFPGSEERKARVTDRVLESKVDRYIGYMQTIDEMHYLECIESSPRLETVTKMMEEAWSKMPEKGRARIGRLLAHDLDGWPENESPDLLETRRQKRIYNYKSHIMQVIISRTMEMLDRRAAGQGLPYDTLERPDRLFAVEHRDLHAYAGDTAAPYFDHTVKVYVTEDGEDYPFWVYIDEEWAETNDDDLKGRILVEPACKAFKEGEIVSLKISEIEDVWRPNEVSISFQSDRANTEGPVAVHYLRTKNDVSETLSRAYDVWLYLSEREKAHVLKIVEFMKRRDARGKT